MPIDTDRTDAPSGPRPGELSERVLAAAKWNYLGVAARVLSQFVAQIVLARLLGPVPFGMFGVCMLTAGVACLVSEMGLGAALVQKRTLTEADIRMAFTRMVAASAGLALLLALVAPLLARFFGDPALTWPLRGIALSVVIQSFGIVPLSLLRRRLEMRTTQIASVAGYIMGVRRSWHRIGVGRGWGVEPGRRGGDTISDGSGAALSRRALYSPTVAGRRKTGRCRVSAGASFSPTCPTG